MKRSLQQIAVTIGARLLGDGSLEIEDVASLASACQRDLIFIEQEKYLSLALASRAGALIAGEFAETANANGKSLLISKYPKLAFARAAEFLQIAKRHRTEHRIYPTASIHPSARIAADAIIEEQAAIAADVEIGASSRISAGCVIQSGVKIGARCEIYPRVTIYSGTTIGDRVIVHAGAVLGSDGFGYVRDPQTGRYEKFPQIGRLVIEDDVEIGANSTIDRGALDETRIGRGTKIDNLVHIGHNCLVGENVVIAAQTGISGSVVVENDVVLGGQVGIGDHVRLEEGIILGSQGGVLPHKVLRGKGVVFWGTPARPLQQYLKQLAMLSRHEKKK
jgi:UDP-3-O-[3-hydroxymyristoyl] glucosamine N-acyltransferase